MTPKKLIAILVTTALFPFLFYDYGIGLNLLVFNLLLITGLTYLGKLKLNDIQSKIVLVGTILSAIFVVYNGSDYAIAINIISLFLLAGTTLFPIGRNLFYTSFISIINFFYSQSDFLNLIKELTKNRRGALKFFRAFKIVIIPIVIVIVFIMIYRAANPVFEGMMKSVFDAIEQFFNWIFEYIELALIMTIIFGFLLSNYFYLGKANSTITTLENGSSYNLKRIRKSGLNKFKATSLISEYKSAIILFSLLNALILLINVIDVWWVWFNFSWDGEYLKQFVHEGTYLLILSIIISLVLSIYYFRGNINFLENNSLLKKLAFIWLVQNAILTISVGIRNYWYINYFSLAYLRIGVIFFLILTLFSIYTVIVKIKDQKSTYFLFSKNSLAAYTILVVMAFFNWDVIIAKYNFKHSDTAFVHFNFMVQLSNKALPYLDKTKTELATIDSHQMADFPFRDQYMKSDIYFDQIQNRKKLFIENWPIKHWQEWNWADERSYRKLLSK